MLDEQQIDEVNYITNDVHHDPDSVVFWRLERERRAKGNDKSIIQKGEGYNEEPRDVEAALRIQNRSGATTEDRAVRVLLLNFHVVLEC